MTSSVADERDLAALFNMSRRTAEFVSAADLALVLGGKKLRDDFKAAATVDDSQERNDVALKLQLYGKSLEGARPVADAMLAYLCLLMLRGDNVVARLAARTFGEEKAAKYIPEPLRQEQSIALMDKYGLSDLHKLAKRARTLG